MMEFETAVLGLSDGLASTHISDNKNTSNTSKASRSSSVSSSATAIDRSDQHDLKVPIDQSTVSSGKKVTSDDFERLCVLGRGAFGKVFLVRHKKSERLYAMKVLKKASLVLHVNHVKTERQILEQVRHPFIVQLYYAFQTREELHMILQYAVGGELFRHMNQEGMFDEPMASFYAAELVLALSHLHSLGIVYRDLKPENCLLDLDGHILLTDFGLSKVSLDGRTNTICGTPEFMAPEILAGLQYDYAVDWWSLGVLIYDMLSGAPPFRGNRSKVVNAVMNKKVTMPYYFTPDAKDLLNKLLRKNPHVRLGEQGIRSHRFFRKIDWVALAERKIPPPLVPVVTKPELAENFDPMFTEQPLLSTSPSSPTTTTPPSIPDHFRHFSYVDISVYT